MTATLTVSLDGTTLLPPGHLASVVTWLEMRAPQARRSPPRRDLTLDPVIEPDLDWYLDLYARIGEPWLWFSRRLMDRDSLARVLHDPAVDVFVVMEGVEEVGLVELDRRLPDEIELAFFGLVPEAIGRGAGRFAMDEALAVAWSHAPARVVLHTCTLDHPRALDFYVASGFVPTRRGIEIVPDPRLSGALPTVAGPHAPIL